MIAGQLLSLGLSFRVMVSIHIYRLAMGSLSYCGDNEDNGDFFGSDNDGLGFVGDMGWGPGIG